MALLISDTASISLSKQERNVKISGCFYFMLFIYIMLKREMLPKGIDISYGTTASGHNLFLSFNEPKKKVPSLTCFLCSGDNIISPSYRPGSKTQIN